MWMVMAIWNELPENIFEAGTILFKRHLNRYRVGAYCGQMGHLDRGVGRKNQFLCCMTLWCNKLGSLAALESRLVAAHSKQDGWEHVQFCSVY